MTVSSAKSRSKRDQAYILLRRLLILQQVPGGARLRETEWSQRLGVNRSALREAFVRLEGEGLIIAGPKTGYLVPEVTSKAFREIVQVRVVLEGAAMEIICESGLNTPKHLKPLVESCSLFEQLISEEYRLGAAEADYRFHETLVDLSRNHRLVEAYRHAPLPIVHPDIISGQEWLAVERAVAAEHREMVDALLQGDLGRAKKCLAEHLLGLRHPFGSKFTPT